MIAPLFAASDGDVADTRTAALQLIGGTVLAIGAFFTARTNRANRTGQIADRFTKAIEQLGNHDNLEIRLGGIYALEQIAKEPCSGHHPQIMEVLSAYVRERAPRADAPPDDGNSMQRPRPPTDVQAVMKVLGRRSAELDDRPLDLRRVGLRGASLARANLRKALLIGAGSYWTTLAYADLRGASMTGARLDRAVLQQADLQEANLEHAILESANLDGARLDGANLQFAYLFGAKLVGANLRGATLDEANLLAADLRGANLECASLEDANLIGARYDERTQWPAEIEPKARLAVFDSDGATEGDTQ